MQEVDKVSGNDINQRYFELLKEAKVDGFFSDNITDSSNDQCELHMNESGSAVLAKDLISDTRNFRKKMGLPEKNLSL